MPSCFGAGGSCHDPGSQYRTQAKPKTSVLGEFWAMTTEGDGNYHLQRFLEKEGAEPDIQIGRRCGPNQRKDRHPLDLVARIADAGAW